MPTTECTVPGSPGLHFVARVDAGPCGKPISATGVATSADHARLLCDSEWAERVAVTRRPDLWRDGASPASAAHFERSVARYCAILEAVERVALAHWWNARIKAHACSDEARRAVASATREWRRAPGRPIALLDITPLGLPPVVFAWSATPPEFNDISFGVASAARSADAASAAVRELTQMEFGRTIDMMRSSAAEPQIALEQAEERLRPKGEARAQAVGQSPDSWMKTLVEYGLDAEPVELPPQDNRSVFAIPLALPHDLTRLPMKASTPC